MKAATLTYVFPSCAISSSILPQSKLNYQNDKPKGDYWHISQVTSPLRSLKSALEREFPSASTNSVVNPTRLPFGRSAFSVTSICHKVD